ncbi:MULTISPECIES: MarR family winged helix-turn-helix transcriptional regulator [Acetobacter]|uniref:MarR family transcriptional regulator n=1 Tax=Acetobacter thailandicus TaxID=1502842 RepID=A0ABT3QAZ3_9PROT|nr:MULTISPECIES: MarR family transcriptional regulator [Acetobacter]MBS0959367.1 MarR family transcriptional regulator [Acetobacter thailandicus]MBS0980554.1 MarR family transcriptional regulator [Acetobacter thailandicus]MBS0984740.1 MarR family transcriptional regulator [Acetobacter thailandicus]MBS1003741.1 MarR family transcriptional regulator [Acetobacter thailandicus]MCX2562449.1 MarR family transcriptional regulator [Acetobacter thailandicus]
MNGYRPVDEAGSGLLFLREEQIRHAQTIMFLANRDAAEAIAPLLEEYDLGRAHYRVLQVLAFSPGVPVSRLRDILGVTKQSLARTLTELHERDYVDTTASRRDRRQKLLTLSKKGQRVEAELFSVARGRLVAAYRDAGGAAVEGFRRVMWGMLSESSRSLMSDDEITRKKGAVSG